MQFKYSLLVALVAVSTSTRTAAQKFSNLRGGDSAGGHLLPADSVLVDPSPEGVFALLEVQDPERSLVGDDRGVVFNDDIYSDCDIIWSDETACKEMKGCYFYPHWDDSRCSSYAGVDCGLGHRAISCDQCLNYDGDNKGKNYCNGECKWHSTTFFWQEEYCENK